MAEKFPAVAMTTSLGNSVCDNNGVPKHVEITRIKVVTETTNLMSDSPEAVSGDAILASNSSCGHVKSEVNLVSILVPKDGSSDGAGLLDSLSGKENISVANDIVIQDFEESDILGNKNNVNGFINEDLLAMDMNSEISLVDGIKIETVVKGQIVAKAVILFETSVDQVPSGELTVAGVSSASEGPDKLDIKASAVVFESCLGKNGSKGGSQNVFELKCIPLWGSASICGRIPEMEDAISAVPWFVNIPIRMLIGDNLIGGMTTSLTYLPSHFFGVYDGHGGSQVAKYCRQRIHLALAEEIGDIKDNFDDGSEVESPQAQWQRAFNRCFMKIDDEVGGKAAKSFGKNDDSDASFHPVAPETVGSTAVVALVCSSHIIVANCGDSRAVLCRGKDAIALSVDHKPDHKDECERIEASGGKVIQWNGHRVLGVLAMSRSIGDRYLKPWIIAEPEVMFVPRARDDECLILASDGLWDVMTNEEVCEVARRRILLWHKRNGDMSSAERGKDVDPAAQAAADYLSMLALQKGSKDNISVIVVDLKAHRKFRTKNW